MKGTVPPAAPARDVIIVAMTAAGVIGDRGGLPWQLPTELALFRQLTMGHALIMGRRTFSAIGRPLPGRTIVVVSRTLPAQAGITVCATFEEARRHAALLPGPYFYAGGAAIYQAALACAEGLWVSWIDGDYPGDCHFPAYDRGLWQPEEETVHPGFRHVRYRRRPLP